MRKVFLLAGLTGLAAFAAPPFPDCGVVDVPEGVSDGNPIVTDAGLALGFDADTTINICVLKVEFLEDYTETTSGNGEFESSSFEIEVLMEQLADYYTDVSQGKLELVLTQYPSGNNAFRVNHLMEYYGADEKNGSGQCELLRDAVLAADPDVDFARYGAVIVIHAGAGNESDILGNSPDDIHSMFINSGDLEYYLGTGFIQTDDGVRVREGCIDPEREAQDNYGLGPLGTIAHEFGHQLGLPDLYNTMTGTVGVGGWDIMGYGQWLMNGYWPSAPGAWSRMALGWETPQTIEPGTYTAEQQGTTYRIPINSTEYFLIENRERDPDGNGQCGPHERDFGLPGSGILIWHVDETRLGDYRTANLVNVDPLHKGVDVEEADGIQDLDYGHPTWFSIEGSEYDPWKTDGYGWEFSPETTPSTDASWGGYSGVSIEVKSNSGNSMDFSYSVSGIVPGWPVQLVGCRFGPVLWNSPQGEYIIAVRGNQQAFAVSADGSEQLSLGVNVTAPPVVCTINDVEYAVLCGEDGIVNLRLPDWSEAPGWPVDLGYSVAQALVSQEQNSIYFILENDELYRLNLNGSVAQGSPTPFKVPIVGACVFPDPESPGLMIATVDGALRRVGQGGGTIFGWPVHPGSENCSLPVASDIDRDGTIEIAVACGGQLWAYKSTSASQPGFPVSLQGEVLADPFLADLDSDGYLEILVETSVGMEAYTSSGNIVSDWPYFTETDSLVAEYEKFSYGIGGDGFACAPLRDGRVFIWSGSSVVSGPFSYGDGPAGVPILNKFSGESSFRLMSMAADGLLGAFVTGFQPSGWYTGMDRGGERCWYSQDLPAIASSGVLLDRQSFFVWPNPVVSGTGNIRFQPGSDSDYSISILNVAGELVGEFNGSASGGVPWEVAWNTDDLSPGVYYICLELNSEGRTEEALFQAAVVN